jgi:hypothetical protein
MKFALAETVANAVLYEGYVLYPYRASSSKNRTRFQFGVVAPRGYVDAGGSDSWTTQTECLIEPGSRPRLTLKVRYLQLQARTIERAAADGRSFEPVRSLDIDGECVTAWDEGVEREFTVADLELRALVGGETVLPFGADSGTEEEEVRTGSGQLVGRLRRERWAVAAQLRLSAEETSSFLRLRVQVENQTPWPEDSPLDRDLALRVSLLGAHTLLGLEDGAFVSLLEPSEDATAAAAACSNRNTWPVLIGPEGSRDVMLSSPIILYDHPAVAPESPGDLCDALEIDEILTLRIMTLTDDEKREARGTDPRARQIVDRADTLPQEIFERLHGAVRGLSPVPTPDRAEVTAVAATLSPELASWEEFLNPPGMATPEEATLEIGTVVLGKGSPVILRPSRRSDSMDLFLAGRTAEVAAIHRDVEGTAYLAVTLADDPANDLHARVGRYYYFYPDEVEPLASASQDSNESRSQEHSR